MRIVRAEVRVVEIPMVAPFTAPFGVVSQRQVVYAVLESETGDRHVGEAASLPAPVYSPDYTNCVVDVLADHFIPELRSLANLSPYDANNVLGRFRGHEMAKAAVLDAVLVAHSAELGQSIAELVGATESAVECGISIGIASSIDDLLEVVQRALCDGYRRIKLKITPSWCVQPVRAVRAAFPEAVLTVDGNGSFDRDQLEDLAELDSAELRLIEQPFAASEIAAHADLQQRIGTAVCLDESIVDIGDLRTACALGACRAVNLKVGRVGGLLTLKTLHDVAVDEGLDLWCGGLMESGVGQSICLIGAGLPGFNLPADIGPSERYFVEDVASIGPLRDGTIEVPTGAGQPVPVNWEAINRFTVRKLEIE